MPRLKEWKLLDDSLTLKTPVFDVINRHCLSPKDGLEKNFVCLSAPEWVNIFAITPSGQVLLVNQFRHGSREFSLELPGGVVEPGQSLIETAQRELMEETGYSAEKFELLCSLRPNPALFGNFIHTFLAVNAAPTGHTDFDENEELTLTLATTDELLAMILDGRIDHAMMVAAIGFYFAKKSA
ncbi:MAG: NUDIX hydrolase [Deltaproteobacteria bacterium]|jgi:8-oxo-dGTP pyrophosphatase MutT (NUDIX family)|nr:NUDIX hydrolase [Deltaproteobacteria bacterium]